MRRLYAPILLLAALAVTLSPPRSAAEPPGDFALSAAVAVAQPEASLFTALSADALAAESGPFAEVALEQIDPASSLLLVTRAEPPSWRTWKRQSDAGQSDALRELTPNDVPEAAPSRERSRAHENPT